MDIKNKKCVPCEGGLQPVSGAELDKYMSSTPEWQLINNGKELERKFKFKNFRKALEFVNKVGEIAEGENHHPDIEFGWGYCNIRLSTHAINGLHENDFIIATKIDGIGNA